MADRIIVMSYQCVNQLFKLMIFYNIGECCRQKTKQALGLRSVVYVDVTSGAGGAGGEAWEPRGRCARAGH